MARTTTIDFRCKHLHDLRGSCASEFLEKGGTVPEAMRLFGWKSIEVAARYFEASETHLSEVLARMGTA
jgi:site-specific recombinase XerD